MFYIARFRSLGYQYCIQYKNPFTICNSFKYFSVSASNHFADFFFKKDRLHEETVSGSQVFVFLIYPKIFLP